LDTPPASRWEEAHLGESSSRGGAVPVAREKEASLTPNAVQDVAIIGAGGPFGAVVAQELKERHRLRLCDIRPLAEIAREGREQMPGAPIPVPLPEHREYIADIGDPVALRAACDGADAIINLSVIREGVKRAFAVNAIGVYNLLMAARDCGIRRVVQTGPEMLFISGNAEYDGCFDLSEETPPRSGLNIYAFSKLMGHEIARVFAETEGIEAPTLLFAQLINPNYCGAVIPIAVTWRDAARALRAALEAPVLPHPYEVFYVTADTPLGIVRNDKIKRVLGWRPQDSLEKFWLSPEMRY
ncbi:MAG: NAD(P)-dependent oxidoreductase, partial [bacterium]